MRTCRLPLLYSVSRLAVLFFTGLHRRVPPVGNIIVYLVVFFRTRSSRFVPATILCPVAVTLLVCEDFPPVLGPRSSMAACRKLRFSVHDQEAWPTGSSYRGSRSHLFVHHLHSLVTYMFSPMTSMFFFCWDSSSIVLFRLLHQCCSLSCQCCHNMPYVPCITSLPFHVPHRSQTDRLWSRPLPAVGITLPGWPAPIWTRIRFVDMTLHSHHQSSVR
ncbi:hypothetical protein L208DRAFT_514158 [Tricholoma matsutake]|nr:hypothetical protein L208DRAFT_514158 [Tricholoma matsutake 945]